MKKNAIFAANLDENEPIESSSLSSGTQKNAELAPTGAFLVSSKKNGTKNGTSLNNYLSLWMADRDQKLFQEPIIARCPKFSTSD